MSKTKVEVQSTIKVLGQKLTRAEAEELYYNLQRELKLHRPPPGTIIKIVRERPSWVWRDQPWWDGTTWCATKDMPLNDTTFTSNKAGDVRPLLTAKSN